MGTLPIPFFVEYPQKYTFTNARKAHGFHVHIIWFLFYEHVHKRIDFCEHK